MEVISTSSRQMCSFSSSLNPNAPLFVPRAYQAVEDFSDEWWELVHSSPWFRDYWLQECFQDPQTTTTSRNDVDDDPNFFPDIDQVFDDYTHDHHHHHHLINKQEEEEEEVVVDEDDEKENVKDYYMDLVSLGALKWPRSRGASETPKYLEKVPKFVNVNKVNPRPIQQPR